MRAPEACKRMRVTTWRAPPVSEPSTQRLTALRQSPAFGVRPSRAQLAAARMRIASAEVWECSQSRVVSVASVWVSGQNKCVSLYLRVSVSVSVCE